MRGRSRDVRRLWALAVAASGLVVAGLAQPAVVAAGGGVLVVVVGRVGFPLLAGGAVKRVGPHGRSSGDPGAVAAAGRCGGDCAAAVDTPPGFLSCRQAGLLAGVVGRVDDPAHGVSADAVAGGDRGQRFPGLIADPRLLPIEPALIPTSAGDHRSHHRTARTRAATLAESIPRVRTAGVTVESVGRRSEHRSFGGGSRSAAFEPGFAGVNWCCLGLR